MSIVFTAAYSAADKEMVAYINAWLDSNPDYSKAELSRVTTINEGTRSSVLGGKYPSPPSEFLERMMTALQMIDDRKNTVIRTEIPFVDTSVTTDIIQLTNRARLDKDFGMYVGRVGIGKTEGLRSYVRNNKRSALLIETFGGIDHLTFLQLLAKAAKLLTSEKKASPLLLQLIEKFTGTDHILLIDEAENLKKDSFEALRRISDKAGIGVMLVGTLKLLPLLQDPDGKFGQVSSRIGFWGDPVFQITSADCNVLVNSYFDKEVNDDLLTAFYQCSEGSARTLKSLMKKTARATSHKRVAITPELIYSINASTSAGRSYRVVPGGA